jgi:hypothetical protein
MRANNLPRALLASTIANPCYYLHGKCRSSILMTMSRQRAKVKTVVSDVELLDLPQWGNVNIRESNLNRRKWGWL